MAKDFYCEQILNGKVPIQRVMETDNVLAFHHTKPSWSVHIVIIPKRHVDSLLPLISEDAQLLLEMMGVVRTVIEQVIHEHGGCRLTTNFGKFQNTKHLHWHVYVSDQMQCDRA